MTIPLTTPRLVRWVERLTPEQANALEEAVLASEVLPPIDGENEPLDSAAVESWLANVAAPIHDRVAAGGGEFFTPAEVKD